MPTAKRQNSDPSRPDSKALSIDSVLPPDVFQDALLICGLPFFPVGFLVPEIPLIGNNTFHSTIWKLTWKEKHCWGI